MKKRLAMLLMLVLMVSMIAGCSNPEQAVEESNEGTSETVEDKVIKVGVCIPDFDDTFQAVLMDGMKDYADGKDNLKIQIVDANEDAAKQLEQVENFIIQGVQAIVVEPVNTEATAPITEACKSSGMPLVYVNRLPANLPDDVVYVGSDSIDAGIFQMDYVGEKLGGKGKIVIMMGKLDNEAAIMRTEGNKKVVNEQFPEIEIIKQQTANWSRAEGMSLMENWLSSGDDIDAVLANNDDMALGAIQALESSGLLDKIIVAGVDATPDALTEIKTGKLDVTVFQDAAGQGAGSIDAAYNLVLGNPVEKEVWIPFQLVTPDNVSEF